MSSRISLSACQRKLATLWFSAGATLFLVMLLMSIRGKYGGQLDKAWSWFLPTLMPTLSLVVGALVFDSRHPTVIVTVDRFLFRLGMGLSIFYLLVVFGTLFLQPVSGMTPLELMHASGLWIGPIQGLVAGSLGAFFVSREASTSKALASPPLAPGKRGS